MDVLLQRLSGNLFRRLEQRPDINFEGQDLRRRWKSPSVRAVVSVLTHLGDEDARPAAFGLGESARHVARARYEMLAVFGAFSRCLAAINAIDALDLRAVTPMRLSIADVISPTVALARAASTLSASRLPLPERAACASASSAVFSAAGSRSAFRRFSLSSCSARTLELSTLRTGTSSSSATMNLFTPTTVCAPVSMRACVRAAGFLDAQFRQALLDRLRHTAELFDLADMLPRARRQIGGEPLNVVGAAPRIGRAAEASFGLQEKLRIARDARGEIGRQRERFVERIGVQALRAAPCRGHRFDAGAHRVVEYILRRQTPAGGPGNARGASGCAHLSARRARAAWPRACAPRASWRFP